MIAPPSDAPSLAPRPAGRAESVAIEAVGVWSSFGDHSVLRGIDLALAPGQRVALIGRNGAGKTTLVRVLAGALRPTAGEVRVRGRAFRSDPAAARAAIGVLGHQSYLYPELTVAENLGFYARLYRVADRAGRIERVLDLVGLRDRRSDRLATLSRGMTQRLALARAALHDPPILLLDEPDAGLDDRALAALESILRGGADVDPAVLLTTHDLEHALRFGHEVAILHAGRVVDRLPTASLDVPGLRRRYAEATAEDPRRPAVDLSPAPS